MTDHVHATLHSLQALKAFQRKVGNVREAADELLDTNVHAFRIALQDPERWKTTTETLATAAEAIAVLQAEVARVVPK